MNCYKIDIAIKISHKFNTNFNDDKVSLDKIK